MAFSTEDFCTPKKQPLACPTDIKRFFVTPVQSGQICLLATFLGNSGNIFFPKLDFHKDQIYFKDIALDFLRENGFMPVLVKSEEEAKSFDIEGNPGKYPIYFFETDTSGEKTYEEFYTENEDFNVDQYESLGFIRKCEESISFDEVKSDFNDLFDNLDSTNQYSYCFDQICKDFQHIETGDI